MLWVRYVEDGQIDTIVFGLRIPESGGMIVKTSVHLSMIRSREGLDGEWRELSENLGNLK